MFERPPSGERAVLVSLALGEAEDARESEEFQELATSAGALTVALAGGRLRAPNPRYLIGSGKVDEIREIIVQQQAELVIFNHDLSPSQERNLESELKCRVLDRTGLILDIFASRARSFEGKLQVELAQLRHLATRLVRGWTHLERQKGGIGLRGPGETQLETDRRLLAERIKQINRRLQKVERQRGQNRQARRRADVMTVALVGYTNAGKSTLFNRLADAEVYAADQLFATLDPTLRRMPLTNGETVVLADTVGFIRRLPHELIAAFRATLQEVSEANLLLHVIDASDPNYRDNIGHVERVLQTLGAAEIPVLQVFNKIDRLGYADARDERDADGCVRALWCSAATGVGIDGLRAAIRERLAREQVHGWVRLPPSAGRLRAKLFSLQAVKTESSNAAGEWLIEVEAPRKTIDQLCHQEGLRTDWLQPIG